MNILNQADKTVNSDRQAEYGDPLENWVRTALITTISQGKPFTPEDVVAAMHAQKLVRAGRGHKTDTNIDQAGYSEIRERVQVAMRNGEVQKIVEKLLGGWVSFAPPKVTLNGREVVRVADAIVVKNEWAGKWQSTIVTTDGVQVHLDSQIKIVMLKE